MVFMVITYLVIIKMDLVVMEIKIIMRVSIIIIVMIEIVIIMEKEGEVQAILAMAEGGELQRVQLAEKHLVKNMNLQ